MLTGFQKMKQQEKINDCYVALNKHLDDKKEIEKRIQSDPSAVATNNILLKEVADHDQHIKRLMSLIQGMEAEL